MNPRYVIHYHLPHHIHWLLQRMWMRYKLWLCSAKKSCCPFPGLSDLPSLGIHMYLYLTVFSMHMPSTGQINWTLILKLASLEPVSSLLFLIHCGQIVLIAHIITFESLDKSWASDISPWQLAPFSVYLFIPKSVLVTLVFKKLVMGKTHSR